MKQKLVGRKTELGQIRACLKVGRNILLEGPVGVGKTQLALAVTQDLKRPVFRIDGDSRYTEQKLSGWFDPPTVMKKGFKKDAFIAGPLIEAMQKGGVLFINELNRLPEGVQNVLLPAIDERKIAVPKLGEISAREGFVVIATQNPKEFVATSHLSEAILDRFELVNVDYQSEEEETQIVEQKVHALSALKKIDAKITVSAIKASVRLSRQTRNNPRVRRGASVRAAISITELTLALVQEGLKFEKAFLAAVQMALPTRIELEHDADTEGSGGSEIENLLAQWSQEVLDALNDDSTELKKKT